MNGYNLTYTDLKIGYVRDLYLNPKYEFQIALSSSHLSHSMSIDPKTLSL